MVSLVFHFLYSTCESHHHHHYHQQRGSIWARLTTVGYPVLVFDGSGVAVEQQLYPAAYALVLHQQGMKNQDIFHENAESVYFPRLS